MTARPVFRFFAWHRTATEGLHLHCSHVSYRRTLAEAVDEVRARLPTLSRAPEFVDFGPGDSDLRRLDRLGVTFNPPARPLSDVVDETIDALLRPPG